MTSEDVILLAAGVIFPVAFAVHVFRDNRRVYPAWAKVASIIVCIAGLGGESSHLLLLHWRSIHLTPQTYYELVGVRGLLFGLGAGFAVSILLARPYRENVERKPE
jgi:hypothetical protein